MRDNRDMKRTGEYGVIVCGLKERLHITKFSPIFLF